MATQSVNYIVSRELMTSRDTSCIGDEMHPKRMALSVLPGIDKHDKTKASAWNDTAHTACSSNDASKGM